MIKCFWTQCWLEQPSRLGYVYLRNSATDTSQRMLNALAVGTDVPIYRHEDTVETVICLCGRLEEIIYERDREAFKEVSRYLLCSHEGRYGM